MKVYHSVYGTPYEFVQMVPDPRGAKGAVINPDGNFILVDIKYLTTKAPLAQKGETNGTTSNARNVGSNSSPRGKGNS